MTRRPHEQLPKEALSAESLRERLVGAADPAYRAFNASLLPGVTDLLGVRIPVLRRMAREIARGDWRRYLARAEDRHFEERMLQGLVIGYVRCPAEEKLALVARFLPKIDNWAVCDIFCGKLRPELREPMRQFVEPLFGAEEEFTVRFAVVTGLVNYVDGEHLEWLLERLAAVRHDGYYVRMGVAWAVSVCFVQAPQRVMEWLSEAPIDAWTRDKALQKIVESNRVDATTKTAIRAMRKRLKGRE